VRWLIAGWADECLGFKARDAHPARTTLSGVPDYYLGAVDPASLGAKPANAEPFSASSYFDQLYEYALVLIKRARPTSVDLSPEDTDRYRGAPIIPARTVRSATAASRRTSGCSNA